MAFTCIKRQEKPLFKTQSHSSPCFCSPWGQKKWQCWRLQIPRKGKQLRPGAREITLRIYHIWGYHKPNISSLDGNFVLGDFCPAKLSKAEILGLFPLVNVYTLPKSLWLVIGESTISASFWGWLLPRTGRKWGLICIGSLHKKGFS
jgi:hypothetical protein